MPAPRVDSPLLVFHHCWDICASISSIFLSVLARSSGREGMELWKKDGRAIGSWPGMTPWRRSLRSMSNSRLRTKSLRRLRSIISLSICRLYPLSGSTSATVVSLHTELELRTKRTILDNRPLSASTHSTC